MLAGRYEIVEELGQGGMGVVYRARDNQLGRDVAIKLVITADDPSETLAARLLREAQALAQLSHPNVVAVYDVGRIEGGVFVAMELVSGVAGDTWLRGKPPWQDVLRVFRDAARGLAAAHAVGLVHRDFKPANLIIGDDGRVRVLDFGLARTAMTAATSGEIPVQTDELPAAVDDDATTRVRSSRASGSSLSPTPSSRDAGPSLLDVALTQVGAIVGTPPYMAPEQHTGAHSGCDARTDQFSFCVSFYRGLYGQRPFDGSTYRELKANVIQGNLRPPPAESSVPTWLRDIVLRGLAVDPDRRWPSMDSIIVALGRDPAARRRKLALGAAALVLVGGAGVALWQVRPDATDPCAGGEQELAGVWDLPRRVMLRAAFASTAKPYAADAFATAARTLDGYTTHWLAMRTDACKATRVHGTQSAELLDLRMACLQRRLDGVRAFVDVLVAADADVVARGAEIATSLPPLDACADTEALRAPMPVPPDPKARARVDAAMRTLATIRALQIAGRYADAQRQLAPIAAEAASLGWRPLEGEVQLIAAQLADVAGDYTTAAKLFKEAAIAAEAGRDDHTAALARNGLVWVIGERLGRYDEAQELARDAAAKIERLGRRELLQADLDQKLAALLLGQGKYEEAEQRSRRVLEIRQRVMTPDHPAIVSALGDLGDIAVQTGRNDEAIGFYRRALAIAERTLGAEHSMCATLRINLGNALRGKGDNRAALVELERARAIDERALGPDHVQLATIAINIGGIQLDEKRTAEAMAQFRKARDLWTRVLGADHPNVATALFRIGQVELEQGHAADATASFERVLEIWKAKLGPEHPSLSAAYSGLGDAARAQKRTADALAHYTRAAVLLEKALGAKNPMLAEPLASIAACEVALGRPKRALPHLERVLALREAQGNAPEIARARSELARVRRL